MHAAASSGAPGGQAAPCGRVAGCTLDITFHAGHTAVSLTRQKKDAETRQMAQAERTEAKAEGSSDLNTPPKHRDFFFRPAGIEQSSRRWDPTLPTGGAIWGRPTPASFSAGTAMRGRQVVTSRGRRQSRGCWTDPELPRAPRGRAGQRSHLDHLPGLRKLCVAGARPGP